MEGRRASVDEVLDELGDGRAGGPVGREGGTLLGSRDLTSEQEPEQSLGQGLVASGGLGEELLALGDGLAAETDALVCKSGDECESVSRSCADHRVASDTPASRTDPSQIMPLMPRMPLTAENERERKHRKRGRDRAVSYREVDPDVGSDKYAPVSLVDGVLAERLVAVLLADGLDLTNRKRKV